MLGYAAGFVVGSWCWDVGVHPASVAKYARQSANARHKPLLNIGCGVWGSCVATTFFGPFLCGDVNLDILSKEQLPASVKEIKNNIVYHGDIYEIPFRAKTFGAVFCSHVLELIDEPRKALDELYRVADEVFVVSLTKNLPHTLGHPTSRWLVEKQGKRFKITDIRRSW